MPEVIQERGVVVAVSGDLAEIAIVESGACEECGARAFCKTSGEDVPRVTALAEFEVKPGDQVRITIPGRQVLLATVYLYGIPLLLLLAGIAAGSFLWQDNSELRGSLLGAVLGGCYYLGVWLHSRTPRHRRRLLPRVDKLL